MIKPINWKDHIVEHPDWYTEENVGNGVTKHTKYPGRVIQQGTAINARNLNEMEAESLKGIFSSLLIAQHVNQLNRKVEGLEGTQIEVTMTNSKKYPFNNSKRTVNLPTNRNVKNYTVEVEVESKTGAGVGEICISDKLLNGFKIEYTGAAKSVTVLCTIRGGI